MLWKGEEVGAAQPQQSALSQGKRMWGERTATNSTRVRTRGGDGILPRRRPNSMTWEKRELNCWGVNKGRELIVGGFPVWPKKEDLEKWVTDHMLPAFPEELRPQVEKVNYPGKRISLVVVVMKSVGTPKENRQLMFKTIKAFNAVKPTFQARGEEHRLWAGPSKPQHLREEDNLVSEALGIAKILFKGREGELDHDYTRQRLFVGERLLASRPPGSQRLEFREEVLVSSIPGYTVEVLNNAREEVKKARLAKRAKS